MMARRDGDDWRKQAKNSLNVRHWDVSCKTFRGDPKLAAQYLPLARVILGDTVNRNTLGGIGYGSRLVKLADGTLIKVTSNQGIYSVDIDARTVTVELITKLVIFVESALLDVRPLVPYGEPKTAATVYPTTPVLGAATDPLWLDEIIIERDKQSNRMRLYAGEVREYAAEITSLAVNSSLEEDDPEDYQDGKFVRLPTSDKRYGIMTNTEMCHFATNTGKMKYWAQCVMGENNTDPYLIGEFINTSLYKYMTGIFFKHQSINFSQGLLTTSDYNYYLIKIEDGAITATFCNPGNAKLIVTMLREGKNINGDDLSMEEKYKMEAYVLASLIINDDSTEYSIPLSGGTTIGEPLSYGWKFNWSGHKASIVTIEMILSSRIVLYNTNRLYTITITDELRTENGRRAIRPVSAVIELIEQGNCTPQAVKHSTWTANPIFYPLHTYHYWTLCAQAPKIYSSNVPVYCWYGTENENTNPYYNSDNESLIVVRFTLESVPSPGDSERDPTFCGPGTPDGEFVTDVNWEVDHGGFYVSYEAVNTDYTRHGSAGAGGTYNYNISYGATYVGTKPYEQSIVNYGPCVNTYAFNPPDPGVPGYPDTTYWDARRYAGTAHFRDGNRSFIYESALIIPFWSAESIHFAELSEEYWSTLSELFYVLSDISGCFYASAKYTEGYQVGIYTRQIMTGLAQASSPKNTTQVDGERHFSNLRHVLYAKQGNYELFNENYEWGTKATYLNGNYSSTEIIPQPGGIGAYSDAFSPIICGVDAYPYHETLYVNLESILGSVVASSSEADAEYQIKYTNDSALPTDYGDRTNSEFCIMFVGWA